MDSSSFFSDSFPQVQPCPDSKSTTLSDGMSATDLALVQEGNCFAQHLEIFYHSTDTVVSNDPISGPSWSAFSHEPDTNSWFAQGDNTPFSSYYHTPDATWPSSHQESDDAVLASPESAVSTTGFLEHQHEVDTTYNYEPLSDPNTEALDVPSSHSTTTHVSKTGMGSTQKDAPEIIGSLLSNGKFKYNEDACARKTFGRAAELRRHINTTHAADKPQFWCHVPSCTRSANINKKPFSREDKLASHIRNMHED